MNASFDPHVPLPAEPGQAGLAFDPLEGTAVLLLDEAGEDVGVGRRGEISVQSRHLALGYWRRPDLTAEAFFAESSGGDERIYRACSRASTWTCRRASCSRRTPWPAWPRS